VRKLSGVTADHVPGRKRKRSLRGRTDSLVTIRGRNETAQRDWDCLDLEERKSWEKTRESSEWERTLCVVPAGCSCSRAKQKRF